MNYNVIKIFKGADHGVVAKLTKVTKGNSKLISLLGFSLAVVSIVNMGMINHISKLEDRVDELETDVDNLKKIKTYNNSDEHYKDNYSNR